MGHRPLGHGAVIIFFVLGCSVGVMGAAHGDTSIPTTNATGPVGCPSREFETMTDAVARYCESAPRGDHPWCAHLVQAMRSCGARFDTYPEKRGQLYVGTYRSGTDIGAIFKRVGRRWVFESFFADPILP
jgi:hypothetical protein